MARRRARTPAIAKERPAPRRRRRVAAKEETRTALVTAALAEFAAHGLDVPSLDAICARAGYTRGAFYVHFRDRAQLMVAVVEYAMGAFLESMLARGDAAHDLERTIARFADAVAQALAAPGGAAPTLPLPAAVPFGRILDAVTRNPALRASFAAVLARAIDGVAELAANGQRARTVRPDVDARHLATVLVLIALGALVAIDADLPLDPPPLAATVARLVARVHAPSGAHGG